MADWIDNLPPLPQSEAPLPTQSATPSDWIDALPDVSGGAQFQQPPSVFERIAHGASQPVIAAKQLFLKLTDPAAAQAYTGASNADEALYQRGLGIGAQREDAAQPPQDTTGIAASLAAGDTADAAAPRALTSYHADLPSIVGNAGMLAPTMLMPGGAIAGSALQGAASGLLTPTQDASLGSTLGNVASGAALGGAMGRFGGALGGAGAGTSAQLPADMAARIEALRSAGITNPPLPAITRSPQDWYNFAELGKQEGPAKDAYIAANQGYTNTLGSFIPGMNTAPAATGYANAEAARTAVQGFSAASQQQVGAMYDAARDAVGANAPVPLQPVADQLGKTIENFGAENIPSAVVTRAKEYGMWPGAGDQTRSFNVTDAEQFRKFLGNNLGPYGSPQFAAVRQLQGSVDEAVDTLAGTAQGDAGAAYQAARAAARQRFATLKPTPIATLANTPEANPNFFQNLYLNGKPGEIGSLYSLLQNTSPDAAEGMRGSLLDYLQGAATQNANGAFSGAALGKALDRVGDDRAGAVLGTQGVGQLRNLQTAATALGTPPNLSGVNTSNTGSTLGNMLQNLHVGPMIGAGLGGLLGHVTGMPAAPEMIGAALGSASEKLASKAAGRRMQAFLNPDLDAIARGQAAEGPAPSALAGLLTQSRTPLQRVLPLIAGSAF
jgi:hypothetical protein